MAACVPRATHGKRATQPCPCGHAGTEQCKCTPAACERYTRRLSGPLLDRIDLRVPVRAVPFERLRAGEPRLDTAAMAERVRAAREIQRARLGPGRTNSTLTAREIEQHCRPEPDAEAQLAKWCDAGRLSARGVVRVLRVARTLADLAGEPGPELAARHVRCAAGWRVDRGG